jgi:hypothetical protein
MSCSVWGDHERLRSATAIAVATISAKPPRRRASATLASTQKMLITPTASAGLLGAP